MTSPLVNMNVELIRMGLSTHSISMFTTQMLTAKSVMDAQTEVDMSTAIPTARWFASKYDIDMPPSLLSSSESVDVDAFVKFKPQFAHSMRGIFDSRIQAETLFSSSHKMAELVETLPDIVAAGLVTYSVAEEFYVNLFRRFDEFTLQTNRIQEEIETHLKYTPPLAAWSDASLFKFLKSLILITAVGLSAVLHFSVNAPKLITGALLLVGSAGALAIHFQERRNSKVSFREYAQSTLNRIRTDVRNIPDIKRCILDSRSRLRTLDLASIPALPSYSNEDS